MLDDEHALVLMVANLSKYKDHSTLLDAWRLILDQRSRQAQPMLALAGRFDDSAEELKQQASKLGISDHVRFLGAVDDIAGLMNASDICVHSSHSEGIPNAVLEAMAAGLPVVGTDIPGIREAVGADGFPFLAPVGDSVGMAEKIELLLVDAALRKSYGQALRERVQHEFSMDKMCTASAQAIADALSSAKSSNQ